jgi:large subunit ribosomal protein L18
MIDKKQSRLRRSRQTRAKILELNAARLTVHRTNSHIYAQIVDTAGLKVIASASTVEADFRQSTKYGGNVKAAAEVGKRIAERAQKVGVATVAFDRSGYKFHGRVKALAQAAREAGLKF